VEMTKPSSDDFKELEALEVKTYEEAKIIRREILQESFQRATAFKQRLADAASTQSFTTITELPEVRGVGIESRSILEGLDELYMFLNDQANQLDEWREQVVQLLLKPLVDEDDEAEITGEEYEESTQLQSDIFVYVQVLRALVRDRQDAFSGQKNMLVDHERRTAIAAAKEGEGPSPEKLLKLFAVRELLNQGNPAEPPKNRSLRTVLGELRTLAGKLRHDVAAGSRRAATELEIVTKYTKETAAHMSEQTKLALALEQEVERYADAMNARIDFYRQFQEISDSVEKYAGPKDDAASAKYEKEEKDALEKLNKAESKHRYLLHLKNADAEADDHRICVICRDTFTIGVLTVCGHQFCKDCITEWFKAHHNCPVCKRHLTHSNLHDITLKPQELRVHSESSQLPTALGGHDSPSKRQKSTIYADFDAQKLADIKEIELAGPSFTTKVDTLVRHLLWLRENDPGAKSIVFSQYQDFMNVLKLAFARHRIGYTSFNSPDGIRKFKEDAGIEVFLLHARAHSSGLNLVNASHVFLCEPLLNTALELQAIARVDRIGQAHETTVWLYVVDGTVEESIYNLSVQRRMEHIGRPNDNDRGKGKSKEATPELMDASLEAANTLEMQQASLSRLMGKGSSGETIEKGDLWQCLFGHVQRGPGTAAAEEMAMNEMRENTAVRSFLAAEAAEGRASGSAS
jgi:E3 ubiquitin-protein ligase SHPRH